LIVDDGDNGSDNGPDTLSNNVLSDFLTTISASPFLFQSPNGCNNGSDNVSDNVSEPLLENWLLAVTMSDVEFFHLSW